MNMRLFNTDGYNRRLFHYPAFTLIELLVVISIIALLLAILMPALGKSRRVANAIVCSNKMRQIGTAVLIYAQENDEFLPRSSHSAAVYRMLRWGQAIMPYLGRGNYKAATTDFNDLLNGMYRCPVDIRRNAAWSYGKNVWFELSSSETGLILGATSGPTYWKIIQVRQPARVAEFGEMAGANMAGAGAADHIMAHFWLMGGTPEIDFNRHGNDTSNFIFLDGHVERLVFNQTFDPNKNIDNWNPGYYDWNSKKGDKK